MAWATFAFITLNITTDGKVKQGKEGCMNQQLSCLVTVWDICFSSHLPFNIPVLISYFLFHFIYYFFYFYLSCLDSAVFNPVLFFPDIKLLDLIWKTDMIEFVHRAISVITMWKEGVGQNIYVS